MTSYKLKGTEYKKGKIGSLNFYEQGAHWENYSAAHIGKNDSEGGAKIAENGPQNYREVLGSWLRPNQRIDKIEFQNCCEPVTAMCLLLPSFLYWTVYDSFPIPSLDRKMSLSVYRSSDWEEPYPGNWNWGDLSVSGSNLDNEILDLIPESNAIIEWIF